MQLFRWRSTALKNYSDGHLIAMARDADFARDLIRLQAKDWARENREWWFDIVTGEVDPDEAEDYDEWMAKLEADLAAEPTTGMVVMIAGSE